jgi:CRISPR-associated protein Cmr1
MEIKLKTLTPLWTGGVDGRMDRVHETGLIGGLRWWYEAIVRGLGGRACDPTNSDCQYDPDRENDGLCDICRVFGATGWRRRFRLVVQDIQMQKQPVTHPMKANRSYQDYRGRTRTPTWWFPDPPKAGHFSIKLQSLDPHFSLESIQGLIQIMVDWSALGAKTQMGFGVAELISEPLTANPFSSLQLSEGHANQNLPSLQNMFFARIQQTNATEVDIFNLKYDLRQLFAKDKDVRHFVMGTVQGDRMAAKVHISRPYANGVIRVWGWVPKDARVWNHNWNRNEVLDRIKQHLESKYNSITWREFNNSRDNKQQHGDVQAFLDSLWENKE